MSQDTIRPYLSAILVGQVQRIARELDAAIAIALGEKAVVVSYAWVSYLSSAPLSSICTFFTYGQSPRRGLRTC